MIALDTAEYLLVPRILLDLGTRFRRQPKKQNEQEPRSGPSADVPSRGNQATEFGFDCRWARGATHTAGLLVFVRVATLKT
jgi:hypothetical protein